jgi:catechol 2,3-dioxygenase
MTPTPGKNTQPYGIRAPGYRLPDETHVGRVRLQVADLERSISYYETVIGFQVISRASGVAKLGPRGTENVLVELHEKPGVHSVARRGQIGLYHFAILLPDRASLGRFVAHLAELGQYAGMSDHLVSEAVYLTDPDGLGIEVYADRPRSTWRVVGEQLAMSSDPLNVPDLVAAGEGKKWDGMPPGTVIGHVHLYVRDIDEASAFYHNGLGLDRMVWSYPGALFMSAGGYHHHLGANTWASGAPLATHDDARMIEWEVVVPTSDDVAAAAKSLEKAGFDVAVEGSTASARDPWGIQLRIVTPDFAG